MIWKLIAIIGTVIVVTVCAWIAFSIVQNGFWSEIYLDFLKPMKEDRKEQLSPNIGAEFFAFWFAILSTIVTSFIIYQITKTQDVRSVQRTYSLQILGAFNEILYQIADAFSEARETIITEVKPNESESEKTSFNLDGNDSRINDSQVRDIEDDAEKGSDDRRRLNFANFRVVVSQAMSTEGHFGRSERRLTEIRKILDRIPVEENRNFFLRKFIEGNRNDKSAHGKLGLHRIQKEPRDILASLNDIDNSVKILLRPFTTSRSDIFDETNSFLKAIERDRKIILEFIHSSEARYAYGQKSNKTITKLNNEDIKS